MSRSKDKLYALLRDENGAYSNSKSLSQLWRSIVKFLFDYYRKTQWRKMFVKLPIKDLKIIKESFKELVDAINVGDTQKGLDSLRKILFDTKGQLIFETKPLPKGSITYRMRRRDDYYLYKNEDMFHIPFDKLKVVTSYRYSISGFPCLYLGASLYSCWEETRRPDLLKVNFSAFKTLKKLNFINILCPDDVDSLLNLKRFIIFALCTNFVHPDDDNKSFKFQYAVPELILSLLVHEREINASLKDIDGIRYISTRYFRDDEMFGVEPIFYNYVIPIKEYVEEGHCPQLKQLFKVTNAKAYFDRMLRQYNFRNPQVRINNYTGSLFDLMERNMWKGKDFKKIKDKKL